MAKGRKTGGRNWKPGQSGNPKGRMPIPEDLRQIQKFSRTVIELILNKYMQTPTIELKRMLDNPDKIPAMELMVIQVLVKGIEKGDERRLGFLFDRVIGKPKEVIKHETDGSTSAASVIILPSNGRELSEGEENEDED